MLEDPGAKLHLIAITKIESLTTGAFDLTFTSEVNDMDAIGMTDKMGDVGEPQGCTSRPVPPSCQANVG